MLKKFKFAIYNITASQNTVDINLTFLRKQTCLPDRQGKRVSKPIYSKTYCDWQVGL